MEESVDTTVDIIDTSVLIPDADTPEIITLQPTGAPLTIQVVSNSRDKFEPIRPKQATIRFLSDSPGFKSLTTFSDAPDDNWLVNIYTPGFTIFTGFLMLTDGQQPFQPDPVTVVLTASDHLALLRDIPLTDFNGNTPEGKFRIADIIAFALSKTQLSLDIKVINNLRHGSGTRTMLASFASGTNIIATSPTNFFYEGGSFLVTGTASNDRLTHVSAVGQGIVTLLQAVEDLVTEGPVSATFEDVSSGHVYDKVFIDARTGEDEIGTCINCYDYLTRLLKRGEYITQWRGQWWIMRVDEFDGNPVYVANFDPDGSFVGIDLGTAIDMSIGAGQDKFFCNADTIFGSDRPHKTVVLRSNYEYPLELIQNIEFERGDLTATIGAEEKHYALNDFGLYRDNFPTSDVIPATTSIYTRRDYLFNNEIARYVVIEQNAGVASNNIMSKPIEVGRLDKVSITVKRRLKDDQPDWTTDTIAKLRLYGNDGTFWTCKGGTATDPIPEWVACDEDFTTNQNVFQIEGFDGQDEREAQDKSVDVPPMPASGYLRLQLYQSGLFGTVTDTYHEPPSIEYIPFINGTYEKYTAQSTAVNRVPDGGYNAKIEDSTGLYDSPRPILKNGMYIPCKINSLLFFGSVTFGLTGFSVPGDARAKYPSGLFVYIESSTNTGYQTVVSATYNVIGNTTAVVTNTGSTAVTETGEIFRAAFYLTSRFYTAAPFGLGSPPDDTYLHPYTYIQAYSIWNQYNTAYRIFTGSVKNLGTNQPDLLHKYSLTDINFNTNNRYFMLLSIQRDDKTGIWNGTFAEVYKTDVGKIYSDPLTFRYLSSSDR